MIFGAHIVIYTNNAEADRAFFSDVLGLKSVDASHGWLIFALPPAEAAFHQSGENGVHELFFMCDDLKAELAALAQKNQCGVLRNPGSTLGLPLLVLTIPRAAVSLSRCLV
jgi:catechol 2,3-dioxygenase-like lactoylglutathione lyase family enzyme